MVDMKSLREVICEAKKYVVVACDRYESHQVYYTKDDKFSPNKKDALKYKDSSEAIRKMRQLKLFADTSRFTVDIQEV